MTIDKSQKIISIYNDYNVYAEISDEEAVCLQIKVFGEKDNRIKAMKLIQQKYEHYFE